MTRCEKIWATRRAKYGESGGNPSRIKLTWLPAEKRGRYDSLRHMHGAELARQIMQMELADASAANC